MAERYNSGTSLNRTTKEIHLDSYERALGADFEDDTYVDLKKLTLKTIKALHLALQDRLNSSPK